MSYNSSYIRRTYGVPAKPGMVLTWQAPGHAPQQVTITSCRGHYLMLRFPGARRSVPAHPTDSLTYPKVPDPVNRGWCGGCAEDRALRVDAMVRHHLHHGRRCPGVGRPPTHRVAWRRTAGVSQ